MFALVDIEQNFSTDLGFLYIFMLPAVVQRLRFLSELNSVIAFTLLADFRSVLKSPKLLFKSDMKIVYQISISLSYDVNKNKWIFLETRKRLFSLNIISKTSNNRSRP